MICDRKALSKASQAHFGAHKSAIAQLGHACDSLHCGSAHRYILRVGFETSYAFAAFGCDCLLMAGALWLGEAIASARAWQQIQSATNNAWRVVGGGVVLYTARACIPSLPSR